VHDFFSGNVKPQRGVSNHGTVDYLNKGHTDMTAKQQATVEVKKAKQRRQGQAEEREEEGRVLIPASPRLMLTPHVVVGRIAPTTTTWF
jgi:hypothetical protein